MEAKIPPREVPAERLALEGVPGAPEVAAAELLEASPDPARAATRVAALSAALVVRRQVEVNPALAAARAGPPAAARVALRV